MRILWGILRIKRKTILKYKFNEIAGSGGLSFFAQLLYIIIEACFGTLGN